MKPKDYAILSFAVETGLSRAVRRLFKHRDEGVITENELLDTYAIDVFHNCVMGEIAEWFDFDKVED